MDKVVVVIKNKEDTPMERFIFAVQNMIEVEPYNKDTRFGESLWKTVSSQHLM